MDIRLSGGGHLAALYIRDAPAREKDEHIDIVQTFKGLNRRRSSVARGGAHNCDTLIAPRQGQLKELANQLHREIFERQCRAMKQLKQEMPVIQLHQRRAGGMTKAGIGPLNRAAQLGVRKACANKGFDHSKGNLFVALTGHIRNLLA